MHVVPVKGRLMRDPATRQPLPPKGITVPDSDLYWARALADGDVALTDLFAPVLDDSGKQINPPLGNLADDLTAPATLLPDPDAPAADAAPSKKG